MTYTHTMRTQRIKQIKWPRIAFKFVCACIAATAVPAGAVHAQGAYAGAWTVNAWKVAPWVTSNEQASVKPEKKVLNHEVIFAAHKITGPSVIGCANPKYEIKGVPFENLFEGGLKKPAVEATALGFKAPVQTLMPGCDMEFHSVSPDRVMFALNNVLYTMVRKPSAKP